MDIPAKNSRPMHSSVVIDAYRLHHALDPAVRQALADAPLDPDDFDLYSLLHQHQPLTAGAFADLSGIPPSTLSSVIRRFTARGHLQRTVDPTDGRVARLSLTESGEAAHSACATRFQQFSERVHTQLGGHVDAARAALTLVATALQAAAQPSAPHRPPVSETLQLFPYEGAPLSESQSAEVAAFLRYLRWRDS